MKGIVLLVAVVGCASDPKPAPVPNPTGCVTLAGNASQDLAVTTDASVCLHLDATPLRRAHFVAGLPGRAGTTSGFSTSLDDASGAWIVDGWDLTVGQTAPQTSATLEWSPPAGVETDVTLIVRASGATATTVSLTLLDPLE